MADMIERVARAMAEAAGFCWENCTQSQWERDARAGIEAMREPTDAMLEAALDESGNRIAPFEAARESGVPIECSISVQEAADINADLKSGYGDMYRAQIDAALTGNREGEKG